MSEYGFQDNTRRERYFFVGYTAVENGERKFGSYLYNVPSSGVLQDSTNILGEIITKDFKGIKPTELTIISFSELSEKDLKQLRWI